VGVPVTGTIIAYAGGVFPVIDPVYGVDGWRSVTNAAVRLAIGGTTPLRMRQGMPVWEQATNTLWQATAGPWNGTNSDWTSVSWNTNGGGGSGTVNNGTAGNIAYYPTTGNQVNGETLTAYLDNAYGTTQGQILFRGVNTWGGTTTGLQVDQHQGAISSVNTNSGNAAVNWATTDKWRVNMNGNTTITFSGQTNGQICVLSLVQTAANSVPTLPSNGSANGVDFGAAGAPTWSTAVNSKDTIVMLYDGVRFRSGTFGLGYGI
jgi:hypothetical protein